jgi:subtilisin family serine protease
VTVAAPGTNILGLRPGGQYGERSGTSMAAAHVSGIAVLLLANNPALTPAEIKRRLISTSAPVAGLSPFCVGVGRANAFNALTNRVTKVQKPVIGDAHTTDDVLIVDGLGFVSGSSVIEVNGVTLTDTIYDRSYARPTGKLTRLSVKMGREGINATFPFDVKIPIRVFNRGTHDVSNTLRFTRKNPKEPS